MDEEGRSTQIREMLRSLLLGTARWMEGVGKQQKPCRQIGFFSAEHAGLPSAVRVATDKYSVKQVLQVACGKIPTHKFANCGDRILKAGPVVGSVGGTRGTERARLAKGEIATQHRESGVGEDLG